MEAKQTRSDEDTNCTNDSDREITIDESIRMAKEIIADHKTLFEKLADL